jgi:hypothetical protein
MMSPMALQKVADEQDTAPSDTSLRLGVWTVQWTPFQRSTRDAVVPRRMLDGPR